MSSDVTITVAADPDTELDDVHTDADLTSLMSGDELEQLVQTDITAPITARTRLARGSAASIADTGPMPAIPARRATTPHVVPRETLQREAERKRLGVYRITGLIASGQTGSVYRATSSSQRRPVAIKALHQKLQSNPAIVARFFAESVVLARISHPNVVRFCDFGYDAAGSTFLVTELLEGETLAARLVRERRLEIPVAIDIAIQIAAGLAAAHAAGVIHRDLKPDNVFLCSNGTVKLLDFGVAKFEGHGASHTLQGDLLGTAAYMSPEQGRSAADSDARSDLYSVGCILFEMLCGVVPYPGTLVETLVGHQTAQRPPARALNPDVTSEIDHMLDRLLARDPGDRIQTAHELIMILGSIESTAVRTLKRPRVERMRTEIVGTWYSSLVRWMAHVPPPVSFAALIVTVVVVVTLLGMFRSVAF